jgi:hypothetical protein
MPLSNSFNPSSQYGGPLVKGLPAAPRKYNINAPWKGYALYIVYGDNALLWPGKETIDLN